jgi:hypothetical protein
MRLNLKRNPKAFARAIAGASVLTVGLLFARNTFSITGAIIHPARFPSSEQCRLFPEGVQETKSSPLRIAEFQSTLLKCHKDGREAVATRKFKTENTDYLLLVEPYGLRTTLEKSSCWECAPVLRESLLETRFMSAVTRLSKGAPMTKRKAILGGGLRHSENQAVGAYLTADLCPSHKALDRDFFERLLTTAKSLPVPIGLSISGRWLTHHRDDFQWIKSLIEKRSLDVTWINHSDTHPYKPGLADDENFLRLQGVDMHNEILNLEKTLIVNGVTPSVFFRYPGLISDPKLMDEMLRYALIPIDADAWISKGQSPTGGSIILVHANGNERNGLTKLEKLIDDAKLPTPYESLSEALKK